MSAKLKVIGLPNDTTEMKLRLLLGNKRKHGGGQVRTVLMIEHGDTKSALVTFEESEAVDIILGRGNTIPVGLGTARVERLTDQLQEKSKTDGNSSRSASGSAQKIKAKEEFMSAAQTQNLKNTDKNKSKDATVPLPSENGNKTSLFSNVPLLRETIEEQSKNQQKNLSESQETSEGCVEIWERTIKAHLQDITKSKDFYVLYLEDPEVRQGEFDEDSIMLDGLNRILYVTFKTKQGADATVRYHHKVVCSNFTKVEIATEEDFNTENNLLSVHGHSFGTDAEKRQLKELVENETQCEVVDIIQQDEPRSAILVFKPNSCSDITELTWLSLVHHETRLVVAPVFPSDSIKVSGLNPNSSDDTVRRYMSSPRSGGNSPVKSFKRLNPKEAVITFADVKACGKVCAKSLHCLEGHQLTIREYYTCLSPDVYNKQIQSFCPSKEISLDNSPKITLAFPPSYKIESIYISFNYLSTKDIQYSFVLCPCAKDFLLSQSVHLKSIMKKINCKFSMPQHRDALVLRLDWPVKIPIQEVRDRLKIGFQTLKSFLDTVKVARLKINEEYIDTFKRCSVFVEEQIPSPKLFIAWMDNVAILFSTSDANFLQGWISDVCCNVLLKETKQDECSYLQNPQGNVLGHIQSEGSLLNQCAEIKPTEIQSKETNENNNSLPLETEIVYLAHKDVIMLEKVSFLGSLRLKYQLAEIILEPEKKSVILKGKKDINKIIHLEILKKTIDFVSLDVSNMFSLEQREFLSRAEVQDRVNHILDTKSWPAHLHCIKQEVILYRDSSVDESALKSLVLSQVVTFQKTVDDDLALMLQSEEGKSFLNQLCHIADSRKTGCLIKLDKKCLHITTSPEQQDVIVEEVDKFAAKYKFFERQIPFDSGKQAFLEKFLSEELKKITESLKQHGGTLKKQKDSITLRGPNQMIILGDRLLTKLNETVLVRELQLKYFGIKEFLSTKDGEFIVSEVENKTSCIIQQKSGSVLQPSISKSLQNSQLSAGTRTDYLLAQPASTMKDSVLLHAATTVTDSVLPQPSEVNCKITFVLGDITKLNAEVIMNVVDSSLKCQSGLSKALLQRGGRTIQDELDSSGVNSGPGDVIVTSAGSLDKCRAIFHVVCSQFAGKNESTNELKMAMKKCFSLVALKGYTSIAIAIFGEYFKFPPLIICDLLAGSLKLHLNERQTCLKQVIFCDQQVTKLKTLIERLKFFGVEIDKTGQAKIADTAVTLLHGEMTDEIKFKSVTLKVKKGDITVEHCDAIVSGINDLLALSSSSAVSKAILHKCGTAVQIECALKATLFKKDGFFVTSAPNLNCQNIFHISIAKFSNNWETCVLQVLTEAEKLEMTSLALPAFGTGAAIKAEYQSIKNQIFRGVERFAQTGPCYMKDVRLVVFSQELLEVFLPSQSNQGQPSQITSQGNHGQPFQITSQSNQGQPSQITSQGNHGQPSHITSQGNQGQPSQITSQDFDASLKSPMITVSDFVDLYIFCDNHLKSLDAEKMLNQLVKDKFKKQNIPEEELKSFDNLKMRQLITEGRKHLVQVLLDLEAQEISMSSFRPEGFVPVVDLVKRLSTKVLEDRYQSLHQVVPSMIIWQFEQGQNIWRDFEPLCNSKIEYAFKNKIRNVDITDTLKNKYRIDLTIMSKYLVEESGKIRGPCINIRRHDRTKEGEPLPKKWDTMRSDENLKLVTLTVGSPEYKAAEDRFLKGGATGPIKKIQRVQNKSLYQQFKAKKREIDQRNPKGYKNERKLFHGTDETTITAINSNGFNRSYCGKNATAYGDGVYFAVNSSYSVGFARPNVRKERFMYIVRVLTGESIASKSGMRHLPNKPGTTIPYDSGSGPAMFIIFHDSQAYPDYLITF